MITITNTDAPEGAKHVLQTRTEKYEDVGEATGNLIIRLYNYVKSFTSGLFYSNN